MAFIHFFFFFYQGFSNFYTLHFFFIVDLLQLVSNFTFEVVKVLPKQSRGRALKLRLFYLTMEEGG